MLNQPPGSHRLFDSEVGRQVNKFRLLLNRVRTQVGPGQRAAPPIIPPISQRLITVMPKELDDTVEEKKKTKITLPSFETLMSRIAERSKSETRKSSP